jgi:hypothetical protein
MAPTPANQAIAAPIFPSVARRRTAEMREDERERRRQRVRDLREQRARDAERGDGLVRKAMGDTLPRTAEVPEGLTLFGDARDQQLVGVLGVVISITRRQLRKELAEELAERDPQLRKIAALELEVAALRGAVDILSGKEPLPPARFPRVKVWEEGSVCYAGDVVTHEGNTWQARRDTAQAPGLADWTCLARAGRDGASLTVRGTYDPRDAYAHLDVVAYNGASFAARKSAPGPCPGPDWQLLAKIGKRGPPGARGIMGLRGERGEAAPTIQSWLLDRARYTATPMMSDGSIGPTLELHALFEQFLLETSDA